MQHISDYTFGDILYLKTDIEQLERILCKVTFYQTGIMYGLACGSVFSEHYDFEVSYKRDMVKGLGIDVVDRRTGM